jgi:hypothetical protein
MKTETYTDSNFPATIEHPPKLGENADKVAGIGTESLGTGSFTTYWTLRANGAFKAVPFYHSAINANSRVFVSISEFNSNAQLNRQTSEARMAIYNVTPFNGGFFAWVEISWSYPLNARIDVLVDP